METVTAAATLHEGCEAARARAASVAFVPTMGYFHEGHLSLVRRARAEHDFVVVSVFVNPLQFGPSEDLERYPRDAERDARLAEEEKVDLLFVPTMEEMYPVWPPRITVDPGPLGALFEGASRPGYFRGVLTVVARLFDLVGPSSAYFGEKDAQQLFLIREMVRELAFPVGIVACPTVREEDGLAMSSRNAYLDPERRRAALCLHSALSAAEEMYAAGERRTKPIREEMARRVASEPLATIDYATVVDETSFDEPDTLGGPGRALVAARLGSTRLIDNVRLG